MKWAALIAWVVTAGGGFVLLTIWLSRGGMRQKAEAGTKIRPPLILSHFLLADGELIILPRIEVGVQVDAVQHVGDELFKEEPWSDPCLTAQFSSDSRSQSFDEFVVGMSPQSLWR